MQEKNINATSTPAEKRRVESTKAILLLGMLSSWVIVVITTVIYLVLELSEKNGSRYIPIIVITILMATCLTTSNFLAYREKLNPAIWLSIISIEISFVLISFNLAHLGIILAIILLIIVGNIILQSLTTRAATIGVITAIVASLITLSIDIFSLNPSSITPKTWLLEIIIIGGGVLFLIIGIELVRYYQFKNIHSQILTAFIIVSVVPIWTITINQLIETSSSLQLSSFNESINTQIRVTILITTILTLIALAVAMTVSNQITSPLNYLITMLEANNDKKSDFSTLLERKDEIGKLSNLVNNTTLKLEETLRTFEITVDERTTYLATKNKNMGLKVDQLMSLVEITRTTSLIQSLSELLQKTTQLISLKYGFYHVAIFLTDATQQYAILKATNSEGGKRMLEKSYQVKIGQTVDSVGIVTSSGKVHITVASNKNNTKFYNPDLPNTCTEITLPLQIDGNIIGALDLQSDQTTPFSNIDDIDIYNLLANQISLTIKNSLVFEETYKMLKEAQAFYRQSATASWRDVLHQGTRGYQYLNGNIEAIKIMKETSKKGDENSKNTENNHETLIIPINIRGKNLGILKIHQADRKKSWSNSEIRVYKSIVDRISFALENARLYQDAQKRAIKERIISEIATKVSSSVNMDNILQTAAEELGRVIPGSEIVIQLEHEDETSTEFKAQE